DLVDRPRHLVADHAGQLRRVGVEADAGHEVGEVDPRRLHADAHLPGGCGGIGRFPHLEDLGGTGPGDPDLAHGAAQPPPFMRASMRRVSYSSETSSLWV